MPLLKNNNIFYKGNVRFGKDLDANTSVTFINIDITFPKKDGAYVPVPIYLFNKLPFTYNSNSPIVMSISNSDKTYTFLNGAWENVIHVFTNTSGNDVERFEICVCGSIKEVITDITYKGVLKDNNLKYTYRIHRGD